MRQGPLAAADKTIKLSPADVCMPDRAAMLQASVVSWTEHAIAHGNSCMFVCCRHALCEAQL